MVIRETVACIQADRDETAAIASKTQELITVVDNQIRVLGNISDTLQGLSNMQFELQVKVSLESVLSFLEAFEYEASKYEQLYRYQRDLTEVGHLTESLISRSRLSKLLHAIHS